MITTTASFDRERHREFTLSVTATDQADEPLIGICRITVVIGDQNDNDPKFENSRYQCEYRRQQGESRSQRPGNTNQGGANRKYDVREKTHVSK